jgi:hypothetical protein
MIAIFFFFSSFSLLSLSSSDTAKPVHIMDSSSFFGIHFAHRSKLCIPLGAEAVASVFWSGRIGVKSWSSQLLREMQLPETFLFENIALEIRREWQDRQIIFRAVDKATWLRSTFVNTNDEFSFVFSSSNYSMVASQ